MLHAGGHFFGTFPSGKRVQEVIHRGGMWPLFKAPMLELKALWKGDASTFGSAYNCAIGDTVTAGKARLSHCCRLLRVQANKSSIPYSITHATMKRKETPLSVALLLLLELPGHGKGVLSGYGCTFGSNASALAQGLLCG